MSNFKPIDIKKYKKPNKISTSDALYWKKLSVPTLVKEFGAIDYIDFSPVEPYYFAVTCSLRVQIYNPITKLVVKNLSRFQENAYGGSFRQDGRLIVAGDEEGFVKMFDASSKNVLRLIRGHKNAVHRTFFTSDKIHIASFSDDKTVKLWDIATEKATVTFSHHTDYIRAGAVNPVSPNIVLSGSYDNMIKMYDTRTEGVSISVNHESPVEALLFLSTGGIFLSAGGTEIRVWDAFAGGKLLAKISQHHKTITTLKLASNGRRIISGGLDRHLKIYDVATYQPIHNMDFPNSILSASVAPNDQTLVVGMVDGLISIQNMNKDSLGRDELEKTGGKQRVPLIENIDHVISDTSKRTEGRHNTYLRKYEYSKALDVVLQSYTVKKAPYVTVGVMQELLLRKGLHRALAGRSHSSIGSIIRFICLHIGENRFTRILTDVANALLDVYEDQFGEFTGELGKSFIYLSGVLRKEVELTYELLELQGALELLTSTANVDEEDENIQFTTEKTNLRQSEKAKQPNIIRLN